MTATATDGTTQALVEAIGADRLAAERRREVE
jgi:hypothetical protein